MAKLHDLYKKTLTEKAYNTIDVEESFKFMEEKGITNIEAKITPKGERRYKVDGKKMNGEEFDRTYGTKMTVDLITAASMSETDADIMDVIQKISSPESMSREEASEVFEDVLGYNPTNFYDKRELSTLLDLAEEKSHTEVPEELHNEIIDKAFDMFETNRKSNQLSALRTAVIESNVSEALANTIATMIGSMVNDEDEDIELDDIDIDIDDDDFDLVDDPEDDDEEDY